ncbi:hypothetical protein [Methylobacterium nigriterrae]|uniref:hypothetical protein n=1 Tax=Methylobacterium nigriterrae TaxID=3127512 RepID=UPI0030132DDC
MTGLWNTPSAAHPSLPEPAGLALARPLAAPDAPRIDGRPRGPGQRERTTMSQDSDTRARAEERAERAERMAKEGAQAMAEHLAAIKAVDERTARLRALRLAKEAADAEARAAAPPPAPRKRKRS